ncbi:MAG: hypothetical protein DRP70_06835 [Spirochaetes bacterium]|nr:MAG: hypothetical protein DRP70_06835 [Spirochaetota bacterium]
MRILIADDETLVRYGLVSVLQDLLPQSTEIIEAGSGVELVEKIREYHPHIAFVDIKMPGMNGLEAIAEVQSFSPNTLWVILTGHADFSYAQAALKLGVEDFLLKPPDPDELKILLKKIRFRIREKRAAVNRKLESRISAVLGDTTSTQFDPFFQKPRYWQGALILWDSLLPDSEKVEIQHIYAVRLIEIIDDENEYSGTLVSMRDGRLLIVFATPVKGKTMDRVIEYWNEQFISLKSVARNIISRRISDTWLLTRVFNNVEELFNEVEKLNGMSALRYLHKPGELMKYSDIAGNYQLFAYLKIAGLLEELGRTWETGQEDDFHGIIHKLEDAINLIPEETTTVEAPGWFTQFVIPLSGTIPDSLANLIQRLHTDGHEIFGNRPKLELSSQPPISLVEKTIATINRRYREIIGIAQIAEELSVSPNYLSTIFKKEAGVSFTRYLTELRLDKSRELLKQPDANIGRIAHSLGYQSGRHFTRLFKDRFGTTPSQWIASVETDTRF